MTSKFTTHLKRYFPDLTERAVPGNTVAAIITRLDEDYPGLANYIVDDSGALRQHVNIFVGGNLIKDRQRLSDKVSDSDEVFVLQALSGG